MNLQFVYVVFKARDPCGSAFLHDSNRQGTEMTSSKFILEGM